MHLCIMHALLNFVYATSNKSIYAHTHQIMHALACTKDIAVAVKLYNLIHRLFTLVQNSRA